MHIRCATRERFAAQTVQRVTNQKKDGHGKCEYSHLYVAKICYRRVEKTVHAE